MRIPLRHHRDGRDRRGLTLIELVITFWVMALAFGMFAQILVSVSTLRRVNRERVEANEAAWAVLEAMRHEPFDEIFSRFNADPSDDPEGKGTAPGNRFRIRGLEAVEGVRDGTVGEIVFPELAEKRKPEKPLLRRRRRPKDERPEIRIAEAIFPPLSTKGRFELREDYVDERLGMPRDLDGDNVTDDEDHGKDYVRLPVCIRLEWTGPNGPVRLQVYTMFADCQPHTAETSEEEDWYRRFDDYWKNKKKSEGKDSDR